MTPEHVPPLVTDLAVGATAITMPLWINVMNSTIQELMLIGGLVLLVVRIWIAIKDLRTKRGRRSTDKGA